MSAVLATSVDPAALRGPLSGLRVLAVEGMQALPYATQLLARLGADVIKIERPGTGDTGRASTPGITDPEDRWVGATYLRNNLNKRSLALDLQSERGRELFLELAGRVDVVAENLRPGALERLGLGPAALCDRLPGLVYLSVSGFGADPASPYRLRPAYAPVVEAMSGIYDYAAADGRPPRVSPMGGVGDIGAGLFAVVGVLAALRERDRTGAGGVVDVAMFDSIVAITDIVTNFWSLGLEGGGPELISQSCRAVDGWFVIQVGREQQFAALARAVGRPEWLEDPRLADRSGWVRYFEDLLRPAIEHWAAELTRAQACALLSEVGVASGPCLRADEVADDEHLRVRDMHASYRHPGEDRPVLVPGNPIKYDGFAPEPDARVPWLGEHTDHLLRTELGLTEDELVALRDEGVIG
ncbi:CoA transferase [Nocardioides marmoriginsengisoli]|uniref:CoA transferase n=1 Tax=Nocardioides marmoriginsengisoli TaxID=661483 RepID=A0A3N0CF68_9ACTN|nr:CaiB/BaiF CoA-transferase family protein [Nocardioides marmoriginsengisoli]RNL62095.1 CoA transferase [Nocardioides marmoriginsengisoli]